jgi:hypothetical protein
MASRSEAESGSSSGEEKVVEIRNERPEPYEVRLKVLRGDRVLWVSADGQDYEVLFKKEKGWPFLEEHETETDSEHGLRVPAGGRSRPVSLKTTGRHGYRVATQRTREMAKPPNGPAVIGEG